MRHATVVRNVCAVFVQCLWSESTYRARLAASTVPARCGALRMGSDQDKIRTACPMPLGRRVAMLVVPMCVTPIRATHEQHIRKLASRRKGTGMNAPTTNVMGGTTLDHMDATMTPTAVRTPVGARPEGGAVLHSISRHHTHHWSPCAVWRCWCRPCVPPLITGHAPYLGTGACPKGRT